MKKYVKKFVLFLLAVLFVVGTLPVVEASNARASYYFSRTEEWVTATGSGKILIEFDVTATHTVSTLGASSIAVWEKQSSGSYKQIKLFTRADGIMHSNTAHVYDSVTYQGTSGTKYYAVVTYYATDSSGSDSLRVTTNTVTA